MEINERNIVEICDDCIKLKDGTIIPLCKVKYNITYAVTQEGVIYTVGSYKNYTFATAEIYEKDEEGMLYITKDGDEEIVVDEYISTLVGYNKYKYKTPPEGSVIFNTIEEAVDFADNLINTEVEKAVANYQNDAKKWAGYLKENIKDVYHFGQDRIPTMDFLPTIVFGRAMGYSSITYKDLINDGKYPNGILSIDLKINYALF
jgi:hypothetical protein